MNKSLLSLDKKMGKKSETFHERTHKRIFIHDEQMKANFQTELGRQRRQGRRSRKNFVRKKLNSQDPCRKKQWRLPERIRSLMKSFTSKFCGVSGCYSQLYWLVIKRSVEEQQKISIDLAHFGEFSNKRSLRSWKSERACTWIFSC